MTVTEAEITQHPERYHIMNDLQVWDYYAARILQRNP